MLAPANYLAKKKLKNEHYVKKPHGKSVLDGEVLNG